MALNTPLIVQLAHLYKYTVISKGETADSRDSESHGNPMGILGILGILGIQWESRESHGNPGNPVGILGILGIPGIRNPPFPPWSGNSNWELELTPELTLFSVGVGAEFRNWWVELE